MSAARTSNFQHRTPKFERLVFALAILGLCHCSRGQTLYYSNLVNRLTDLEYLSTLPAAGDECALWSSYDRSSYYDTNTGQYVSWSANNDCCGIIRTEGASQVLAEMQGPGCIWRMWSATPSSGHVRVYLDGTNDPPVLDLPFSAYFDGQHAPFTNSAIVHTTPANGWNNCTPIPYQTSCKIVADSGWGSYYQFTYETFPPNTQVPTFNPQLSAADAAALANANQVLSHPGFDPAGTRSGQMTLTNVVVASGGSTQLVAQLTGPEAITSIRMNLNLPPSPDDYDLLRTLTLQITWDGEATPSVWAPLGDFFGTAPGGNQYSSLPLGHTSDGWWYCYWYMPFGTSARVELVNDGTTPQQATFQVTTAPLTRPLAQLARFHAKWHRDAFLPADPNRSIDWTIATTTGTGRFVGTMLHIWNPQGGWWGEGDDKFFVDDEKFPSSFGTGSEDYFGYAWSSPVLFQHALHNQTHNDGNSKGHVSVNRWHIADSVPFQQSFQGCIEKYYSNQRPTLYAAMAYWYLASGGTDPYPPVPLTNRVDYWTPLAIYRVPGAIEGEMMMVLAQTAGTAQAQDMSSYSGQWSGNSQLWWSGAQPGDTLDLALAVTNTGNYRLTVALTKARDYGIVQLYLDGQALGSPIDLYNPLVVTAGPMLMGAYQLTAGQHTLRSQIVGANPSAITSYMFGLDYVKLDLFVLDTPAAIPTLSGDATNEARAIAPDGLWVAGVSGSSTNARGFLYDVTSGNVYNVRDPFGAQSTLAAGVCYRTSGGQQQVIVGGLAAGWNADYCFTNGTAFAQVRRDNNYGPSGQNPAIGIANVRASGGGDVFWGGWVDIGSSWEFAAVGKVSGVWQGPTTTVATDKTAGLGTTDFAVYGISATGRAVGYRNSTRAHYVLDWTGAGTPTTWSFNGLNGTTAGAAFAISTAGTFIFGQSPVSGGRPGNWGYKAVVSSASPGVLQSVTELPSFADTVGTSGSAGLPYGCTPDGNYAVGMSYRGTEKAVVWDTHDASAANWTVTDLTDLALAKGAMGIFSRLARAYSVGTDGTGNLVIAGMGLDTNSPAKTRAFLMTFKLPGPVTNVVDFATASSRVFPSGVRGQNPYRYANEVSFLSMFSMSGPSLMRGVAGGLEADTYDWRVYNSGVQWGGMQATTLDFLRQCRDTGSTALFTANMFGGGYLNGYGTWICQFDNHTNLFNPGGYGTNAVTGTAAQLAADWVHYCNVLAQTYRQGQESLIGSDPSFNAADNAENLRVYNSVKVGGNWAGRDVLLTNGEPAIPKVIWWEVGNEPEVDMAANSGAVNQHVIADKIIYRDRYRVIANAMKAVDGSIQTGPCITVANNGNEWLGRVAEDTNAPLDFVGIHPYYYSLKSSWPNPTNMTSALMDIGRFLADHCRGTALTLSNYGGATRFGTKPAGWQWTTPLIASEYNPVNWGAISAIENSTANGVATLEHCFRFAHPSRTTNAFQSYFGANYWQEPQGVILTNAFEALRDFTGDLILENPFPGPQPVPDFGPQARPLRVYVTRQTNGANKIHIWGINFSEDTNDMASLIFTNLPFAVRAVFLRSFGKPGAENSLTNATGLGWTAQDMTGSVNLSNLSFTVENASFAILTLQETAATNWYWDTSTSAGLQGGNGTWSTNLLNGNWSTTVTGENPALAWADGKDAVFDAALSAGGTITVTGTVSPRAVIVNKTNCNFGGPGTITVGVGGMQLNASIQVSSTSTNPMLAGAGGVVVNPGVANTVNFNAANTYTGDTVIATGTLALGSVGSISNTARIIVSNAATFNVAAKTAGFVLEVGQMLGGNGSVVGRVAAYGTVSPGASVGTLSFSTNLTLAGTTVMEVSRNGSTVTNDAIVCAGTLTYGGTLVVTNSGPNSLADGDTFRLFSAVTTASVFGATNLPSLDAGFRWDTGGFGTGVVRVVYVGLGRPAFQSIAQSGTNLILGGSNGVVGTPYYLLTSTNLALPLTNWTRLLTNVYGAGGSFSNNIPLYPAEAAKFYRLQSAN